MSPPCLLTALYLDLVLFTEQYSNEWPNYGLCVYTYVGGDFSCFQLGANVSKTTNCLL